MGIRGVVGAVVAAAALLAIAAGAAARDGDPRNPIVPGWYADPEMRRFGDEYWIYPTLSAALEDAPAPVLSAGQRAMRAKAGIRPAFLGQTWMDVFSSRDLVHWIKHARVLDVKDVGWAAYALWAPSVLAANGRYYLFSGANDIHPGEVGGIGVAVADRPTGPFQDLLGRPLISRQENGAQPIDQFAFRDDDGVLYLYYGGWGHLNVVRLAPDLRSLLPWPDRTTYKEITPPGSIEGSSVVKRRGVYFLMWSEGGWTKSDYRVAYATGKNPVGPFTPRGVILQGDERVARGAGHHSVVRGRGRDEWWIAYHRRPLDETAGDHWVLAVDRLVFERNGTIRPVMTGR